MKPSSPSAPTVARRRPRLRPLPAGGVRHRPHGSPVEGRRIAHRSAGQLRRAGRGGRLQPPRPALQGARVPSPASLGRRLGLRRRELQRHQPGTDQRQAAQRRRRRSQDQGRRRVVRRRQAARRGLPRREQAAGWRAGPWRRRDPLRERPRPRHHARERRAAGRPDRRRARASTSRRSTPSSPAKPRDGSGASSATRGSTSSRRTWRWTASSPSTRRRGKRRPPLQQPPADRLSRLSGSGCPLGARGSGTACSVPFTGRLSQTSSARAPTARMAVSRGIQSLVGPERTRVDFFWVRSKCCLDPRHPSPTGLIPVPPVIAQQASTTSDARLDATQPSSTPLNRESNPCEGSEQKREHDADLPTKPTKSFGQVAPVRSRAVPHDAV